MGRLREHCRRLQLNDKPETICLWENIMTRSTQTLNEPNMKLSDMNASWIYVKVIASFEKVSYHNQLEIR